MDAPLRGLWLFVTAAVAVTAVVSESANARRYVSYRYASPYRSYARHHDVTGAIPRGAPQAPAAVLESGPDRGPGPLRIPNAALEPARWSDLDGWATDDHARAYATFFNSCRPIVRSAALKAEPAAHPRYAARRGQPAQAAPAAAAAPPQPGGDPRPVRAALEEVCARAIKAATLKPEAARQFFETNFVPVHIRKLGDAAGFLTGYYEPIVDGSRFPTREFSVPLYRRPHDIVAPGYPQGGAFPNSGKAFRRTPSGELVPYYDRGEIEDGALDGQHLEICWLRSATDALFIQIEGSARVRLEDGAMMGINYDAHNGYPYVPVGRVLIERHLVPREEMSMQRIREWMHDNPDGAKEVRRQNRSVVFFRIVGLDDDVEALGAQGIPLSAGRSIAVDKALHVYGTPFFIEADLPLASARSQSPFRRTMIAQDTGSAIVGPARADLFFGAGDEAGQMAGRVRHPGRFAILLPRQLDPTAAGARMPLPPAKPVLMAKLAPAAIPAESGLAVHTPSHPAVAQPRPAKDVRERDVSERDVRARDVRERRRSYRYWQ